MLNQREIFFITLLCFEISKTKFKDHSLPKEADNMAVCFVQKLQERSDWGCRRLPVYGRSPVLMLASPHHSRQLWCHQLASLCWVPDFSPFWLWRPSTVDMAVVSTNSGG